VGWEEEGAVGRIEPKKLLEEGWRRQSVDCDPRLSEAAALYEALGHEVLLVPVLQECASEGGSGGCTACFGSDADPDRFKVIYTRPKSGAKREQDDLFEGG
jgi:hypothetical protein